MLETSIHSPLNHSSQAENKDVALEEVDLAGKQFLLKRKGLLASTV